MIDRVISIIREHPSISNNWSITPNRPDTVDLTIGNTEYTIRSKQIWEKVEVTYKGAIRNVLGLTEGRWRSLDDFKVWLQEQISQSGESNVPTFKQFYLSEAIPQ